MFKSISLPQSVILIPAQSQKVLFQVLQRGCLRANVGDVSCASSAQWTFMKQN